MTAPSSASADASPDDPSPQESGDTPAPTAEQDIPDELLQGATQLAHLPSIPARLRMLWASRRILRILVIRDLKVRYADTVLGFAWTFLDPILLALTYWLVFGVIIGRGASNEQPYLLWVLTGIIPFQWTTHVLGDSGRLLGNDAKLVTASSMPREIWVLRTVTSRGIEFLFTLPITFVAMALFALFYNTDEPPCVAPSCLTDMGPSIWLFLLPVAFLVQFIFNVGLGLVLAPACMLYPDIHRVVRVFSTMYRYLSPVVYGLATLEVMIKHQGLPSWVLRVYELNPMVGILNAYHAVVFTTNVDHVLPLLGVAAFLSTALLVVGLFVFRRLEPRVLKEL
jgi:ABC-2 type transport system permease protein